MDAVSECIIYAVRDFYRRIWAGRMREANAGAGGVDCAAVGRRFRAGEKSVWRDLHVWRMMCRRVRLRYLG